MRTLVVDASVAAKLLFPEPGSDRAEAVFRGTRARLVAPGLLWLELASVIWKRRRRGEIDLGADLAAFEHVDRLPVERLDDAGLLDAAFELAVETDRTVYDCLYVAAAISERGALVTADKRLAAALKRTPLAGRVRSLGEFG